MRKERSAVATEPAFDFDLGPLSWVQSEIDQALSRPAQEQFAAAGPFEPARNDARGVIPGFMSRTPLIRGQPSWLALSPPPGVWMDSTPPAGIRTVALDEISRGEVSGSRM